MYFLAIDLGASSGRHILGYLENNKLMLEEVYRFKNKLKETNNHLIWDVNYLFKEIINGLKECKRINKIPSYIGIDTWAVDYALLDENDNLIDNVYAYRDNRTNDLIPKINNIISFAETYQKTGIQYQPFNTIYQLYHDKISGKLAKAKTFLMLPDYFNFLLTGIKRQEYTNATSTGLVNKDTHTWDNEILDKLGYKRSLFLNISQPGEVVGCFKDTIVKEVGYLAKIVLPATHDTASAVLAVPDVGNSLYISSGTWSLLGTILKEAKTDKESLEANYSNEGSINYEFRYQKNIMGLWILQQIRKELEDISFVDIINMAKTSQIKDVIDIDDPRFLAPKSMIEEVKKTLNKDLKINDLIKVVYNSLGYSYKKAILELENNLGVFYENLNIIGGGSQDKLLNQLTANITNKKVITGPVEATAIGNILMQMLGVKVVKDFNEAKNIIKNSFELEEYVSANL